MTIAADAGDASALDTRTERIAKKKVAPRRSPKPF